MADVIGKNKRNSKKFKDKKELTKIGISKIIRAFRDIWDAARKYIHKNIEKAIKKTFKKKFFEKTSLKFINIHQTKK